MDGSRFDAWTRRHFGLAAGGLAASLMWLAAFADTDAKKKKKKKKKKCKKLGTGCTPGGKRKCCKKQNLICAPIPGLGGNRCCRDVGQTCTFSTDCCSTFCLDDRCQPSFCKELGQFCDMDEQCCSDFCEPNAVPQDRECAVKPPPNSV
jgi:hypothetical protein